MTELSRAGGRRVWALAALVALGAVGFFGFRWLTAPDLEQGPPITAGPSVPVPVTEEPTQAAAAAPEPEVKAPETPPGSSLEELSEEDKAKTAPTEVSRPEPKCAPSAPTRPRQDPPSGKSGGKDPLDILGTNPYR